MFWIIAGVLLAAAIGGGLYWRYRQRRQTRLISFVALLHEPVTFDPAVVAHAASRAWKADLGDGSNEGADGFVVGVGVMTTLMHQGRMYLLNSLPNCYIEEVEQAAQAIGDLRVRSLFLEHRAWFSCDALGVDGATPAAEVRDLYRRLALLFAELLDDNCLLIFLPDSGLAFPLNDDTEAALRSPDPVQALQDTLTVPIIEVADDDPLLVQAVARARQEWPKFVAAFEARAGENFSVKAPISYDGRTEFIWLTVTAIEGGRVYGELGNDPGDLGPLRLGSKVVTPADDLNDWGYLDARGELIGGFTIEAIKQAARRKRKE